MAERDRFIELFRQYLRFRTVSAEGPRTGSYRECVLWLKEVILKEVPLFTVEIVEPVENKPVLIATLKGEDETLDSVVLNSHYDVVPVVDEFWNVDPWDAVEKDGRIYGRGTQDMKCVTMQYIFALGRIYRAQGSNVKHLFKRNLFLTVVPDEEIGGRDGMHALLSKGYLEKFGKIGVALDEGLASETDDYTVFYGERLPVWCYVISDGPTGHGSRFIQDTAIEKLTRVANKAFGKRAEQEKLLGHASDGCKHCEAKKLGDVLTINLTMLKAGVSSDGGETYSLNVIPTQATAGFDIRVPVTMPMSEVRKMLDDWTSEEGLSWKFYDENAGDYENDDGHAITSIDPNSEWWSVFSKACKEKAKIKINTEVFPAGTDSRFLRMKGIDAFGFSPMSNTPILLHEHNEYIESDVYINGIKVYQDIIPELANHIPS